MTPYIARRWQDRHGLVHVISPGNVYTWCRLITEISVSDVFRESRYTHEPVTCLMCMIRSPQELHADDA